MTDARIQQLFALIRDVPDFPKPGIVFKDITPLLSDGPGFKTSIDIMAERAQKFAPDLITGPEARGFIFGAPLAAAMGIGFAPLRKPGKLPWRTVSETYALEYGEDEIQAHEDAFPAGKRVLLVDDLLATGGTIGACRNLVEQQGATVVGALFLIELDFLAGRTKIGDVAVETLLNYT